MAGRGSRFSKAGFDAPKPLIELHGRPFFWWATQSVIKQIPDAEVVYVVLREHIAEWDIEARIREHFPRAMVIAIDDVTAGALDTACLALPHLAPDAPLIINDCDHYFSAPGLPKMVGRVREEQLGGFLCHFESDSANFSYAAYDAEGRLTRTAEKQPISRNAIAGAYGFRSPDLLADAAAEYREACRYAETYVSGVYNVLAARGETVRGMMLESHVPFGTPEEHERAAPRLAGLREME